METSVTVKPSLAIAILKSGLNVNVPMFLWGPPGIGKSQIVAKVAAFDLPRLAGRPSGFLARQSEQFCTDRRRETR